MHVIWLHAGQVDQDQLKKRPGLEQRTFICLEIVKGRFTLG